MGHVPAARRGRLGVQLQDSQMPAEPLSERATAPATRAQRPHPARPSTIDTSTATARATRSLVELVRYRIDRLSRARGSTDVLVIRMVSEVHAVTPATLG